MKGPRIGTLYRFEILRSQNRLNKPGKILDVGCHDGYILRSVASTQKFGIDLHFPDHKVDFCYVVADGEHLPFMRGSFDQILALDVIEHVQDPQQFVDALMHVITPNGNLFLTTPSGEIHMIPHFLTKWISRKWGHTLRLGFSMDELLRLFHSNVGITTWNAPAWRFFYLPLSLIYRLIPGLGAYLVHWVALWDFRHSDGTYGYYFCEFINSSSKLPG